MKEEDEDIQHIEDILNGVWKGRFDHNLDKLYNQYNAFVIYDDKDTDTGYTNLTAD